jgi:hypothetical protein
MSESEAAGRLMRIPGIVEAAPTKPDQSVGTWSATANGLSNVFDIVELKMANAPITQITKKILLLVLVFNRDHFSCLALNRV